MGMSSTQLHECVTQQSILGWRRVLRNNSYLKPLAKLRLLKERKQKQMKHQDRDELFY